MTLLMACVLTGGLVCTTSGGRQLGIGVGDSDYLFTSTDGFLRWTRYTGEFNRIPSPLWQRVPAGSPGEPIDGGGTKWSWHWSWCGFDFGNGKSLSGGSIAVWSIPYWTGIPLTLLSAYLLLTKPRKSTSDKLSEPVPTEGT